MHSVFFELFYLYQSVKGISVSITLALTTQQYMCLSTSGGQRCIFSLEEGIFCSEVMFKIILISGFGGVQ